MSKIGIMQPYFFPYIGYFSLINYTDRFIYFNTVQYMRKSWINRNRILNSKESWSYVTVPIMKAKQEETINNTKIDYTQSWQEKILGQLTVYKKKAPFYNKVIDLVKDLFSTNILSIDELAIGSIEMTCDFIGIQRESDVFSKMDLKIDEVFAPDEWALNITKTLNYETYVNPPGGKEFFDPEKYRASKINLEFLSSDIPYYNQRQKNFEPGLSILDVMMFCSEADIKYMLEMISIEKAVIC